MPPQVKEDWIAAKSGKVLTECGHITFPDALFRLGGTIKVECHKCGRVVKIIRKATSAEYLSQVLDVTIDTVLPDIPPF
jgi:hypothetical protein